MEDRRTRCITVQKIVSSSGPVVYLMSRDQRIEDNHALLFAQKTAITHSVPLLVVYNLLRTTSSRAREQYQFMLDGLKEVEAGLKKLCIPFLLFIDDGTCGSLAEKIEQLCPSTLVCDASSLKGPRGVQQVLAENMSCPVYVTDTHNIIPMWEVSSKKEVGAYTFRPKIHTQLSAWLTEPPEVIPHPYIWSGMYLTMSQLSKEILAFLDTLPTNNVKYPFLSGEAAAKDRLNLFLAEEIYSYAYTRNDPNQEGQSNLSPYLHFGQVSSLRVVIELQKILLASDSNIGILESSKLPKPSFSLLPPRTDGTVRKKLFKESADALIEEMVVRKELSDNFCYYEPNYKSLLGAPRWAINSLDKHLRDKRDFIYTKTQFENAMTHDEIWNAAQNQLRCSGKIHGYMRMYWAKKVLEWTVSPKEAVEILIYLNDFYSIDGGDPNGYAGILWSVAGLHDRPWFDREVYGVIRYMNASGLKKKFRVEDYCKRWSRRYKMK